MKRISLLLFIALLTNCENKQNNEQKDSTVTNDTAASLPVEDNVDPDEIVEKFYSGNINGNIEIEALLTFGGNEVVGSYRYITQDVSLSLGGTREGETIRLYEKSEGKVTGTFGGTLKGDSISGTWSNGKKEFPFLLKLKSTAQAGSVILGTRKYGSKRGQCTCGPYRIPYVVKSSSQATNDLLYKALGYQEIIGDDACDCNEGDYPSGQISSDYSILYNKGNYLSVSVYIETMGAYPDSYRLYKNFDLQQNKAITLEDLYTKEGIDYMLKIVQDEIKGRLDEAKEEGGEEPAFNTTVERINSFSLGDNTISLQNNLEFPHYIKSMQPDDEVTISVSDLQKYEKVKWYE